MGFKDANWAYTLDLPMAQKVILVAICHRTDDKTHTTIVGQQTIATMTGASVDTVGRAMKVLATRGIVERTRRTKAHGQRSSDRLLVNVSYSAESGVGQTGTERIRDAETYSAESGNLTRTLRQPNPHSAGGNRGQSVGQSVVNVETTEFDQFWDVWPRQFDRPKAAAAWKLATRVVSPATILEAARAYRDRSDLPETRFIPYPATWLDRRGWEEANHRTSETTYMQTVQPGSDCGPGKHLRLPDGTCRICEARRIPEGDAWPHANQPHRERSTAV